MKFGNVFSLSLNPIHCAIMARHSGCVKILLEHTLSFSGEEITEQFLKETTNIELKVSLEILNSMNI